MAIKPTDRWRAPSRGTPAQAIATCAAWGSFPIRDVSDAIVEIYRLCELVELDAALLVAHAGLETGDARIGRAFLDGKWATVDQYQARENRYNIAGIGVTDGGDLGYGFASGLEAARAFVVHHAVYEIPASDPAWSHLQPYIGLDPRYDAVAAQYRGTIATVAQMTGRWWTNPVGHTSLASRGNQLFPGIPDQQQGSTPVATFRAIISMGHRNTDRGGASGESAWTPGCARAIRDEIVRRGGHAIIVQEHDGDSDKNWYPGGLQAAARRCVELAKQHGPFDIYVSCHYNGGVPGFHAIYPDAHSGADVGANNPKDIQVCRDLVAAIRATRTVKILGDSGNYPAIPGVMSERETRVGAQGYRLGEMAGTVGFRMDTVRVILEAGGIGTSDDKYLTNPKWLTDVYAPAIVNGLEKHYGRFSSTPTTTPKPTTPPDTVYGEPIELDWIRELRTGKRAYVDVVTKQADGSTLTRRAWALNRMYVSTRDDERRQVWSDGSGRVNENVAAGTPVMMTAAIDGLDGRPRLISSWNTVFDADDWQQVAEPETTES